MCSTKPDVFDIGRAPNEHLAFGGYGEHFCLGATLARLELRGIYGHLLERLEEIRVDGDVERLGSGLIGGIKRSGADQLRGSWGVGGRGGAAFLSGGDGWRVSERGGFTGICVGALGIRPVGRGDGSVWARA